MFETTFYSVDATATPLPTKPTEVNSGEYSTRKWENDTETWQVSSGGLSTQMLIVIVAAASILVLIIVFLIYICQRKRRKVWNKRGRGNGVEQQSKTTPSWMEHGARSPSAVMRDSGFREDETDDIEQQPRFSLSLSSVGNTNTLVSGYNVATDTQPPNTREHDVKARTDRETIIYDSNSKSFRVKADLNKVTNDDENVTSINNEATQSSSEPTKLFQKREEDRGEAKQHQNKPETLAHYEFAYPVNETNNADDETREDNEDDVYITMHDMPVSDDIYVNETFTRDEEDEPYANSLQIHRFQSLIEKRNHGEGSSPKRSVSEILKGSAKPPKPQPRLSKKREFDPYDYLPRVRKDINVNSDGSKKPYVSDCMTGVIEEHAGASKEDIAGVNTYGRAIHENNKAHGAQSDTTGSDGEDVYDYPRSNRSVNFENVQIEQM